MSIGDEWGTYRTPCPNCNGQVDYGFFGSDCRGNPPSSSIACKKCGRKFTVAEWNLIARDEMRERAKKEQLEAMAWKVRHIGQSIRSNNGLIKQLEDSFFSGKNPESLNGDLKDFHRRLLEYTEAFKEYRKL